MQSQQIHKVKTILCDSQVVVIVVVVLGLERRRLRIFYRRRARTLFNAMKCIIIFGIRSVAGYRPNSQSNERLYRRITIIKPRARANHPEPALFVVFVYYTGKGTDNKSIVLSNFCSISSWYSHLFLFSDLRCCGLLFTQTKRFMVRQTITVAHQYYIVCMWLIFL